MSHDAESRDGSLTESRVAEGTELGPVSKGIQKGSERDTEAGRKEPFSIARVARVLACLSAITYMHVTEAVGIPVGDANGGLVVGR